MTQRGIKSWKYTVFSMDGVKGAWEHGVKASVGFTYILLLYVYAC